MDKILKGCFVGAAGCVGGCAIFVIGIILMFGLFVTTCVGVVAPIAQAAFGRSGVELSLSSGAPRNCIDLIVNEVKANDNDRHFVRSTYTWKHNDRAWIRFGTSRSKEARGESQRAIERAIERLERNGVFTKGSVRVVGYSEMDHDFDVFPQVVPSLEPRYR